MGWGVNMVNHNAVILHKKLSFRARHSFLLFIVVSILIASVVIVISMIMYNGSGAAQLDLSRPGYVSIRSQATANDDDFQVYSSTGAIGKDVIAEFKALYDSQAQKIKIVDAFGGDPLSPDALGINAPSGQ